jgi:ergothioneine biosynthesis protein EgtB
MTTTSPTRTERAPGIDLAERYRRVRRTTEWICQPLSDEDCVVQPMPDASPVRWHLAHTTWFFETFVLKQAIPDYREFHPDFVWLFNSYYNAVGPQWSRPRRGLLTRPTVAQIREYRAHVDAAMAELLGSDTPYDPDVVTLGLNHEQQHQELIVTDVKYLLAGNPLHPVYRERSVDAGLRATPLSWVDGPDGVVEVGFAGDGFAFDNESPPHKVYLDRYQLASRAVTCGEFRAFIADGGYRRFDLWLSDGWNAVREREWAAPLYWEEHDGAWWNMTLGGFRPVVDAEPVTHVSYYEADAFARWAGHRLPTEAEWECLAADLPIQGNFLEDGRFHPAPAPAAALDRPVQLFGDVWEWTQSAYSAYPRYRPVAGALGEYNAKFMCNQLVLRGGSCATPRDHIRPTYRNFFPPDARWQFSGVRLARDV